MGSREDPPHVAIIGAGIAGITLGLGLLERNIPFKIYERAPGFREIGAGIGFSPNSERAMGSLSPAILSAFKRVANPNGEDYFQWMVGHAGGSINPFLHQKPSQQSQPQAQCQSRSQSQTESDDDKLLFKLHVGKDGFQGSRRSDILEEWSKQIPPNLINFGKELESITDNYSSSDPENSPVEIRFKDGTLAKADLVIGCDGIRSRVRQHVLSPPPTTSNGARPQLPLPLPLPLPKSVNPHYTGKFCFRDLVPMPDAVAAIGEYKSSRRFMYNGPGAHVITYPVAGNTFLNVLVVISDSRGEWPAELIAQGKHTVRGSKQEAVDAFRGWNRTVRSIVDLLPDELEKWAIFDMAEHPAETYVKGRVALAGDAAHATGPHLGAGGGLGVEDALCLAGLVQALPRQIRRRREEGVVRSALVEKKPEGEERRDVEVEKGKLLVERALKIYNDLRYERTQWVMQATREAVDLFQWKDGRGREPVEFAKEITEKFHKIWNYGVDDMVQKAVEELEKV